MLNVLINYPEYTIVARLGFVDTLSFFNSFSNHYSERIIDREKQCSSFSKAYVCGTVCELVIESLLEMWNRSGPARRMNFTPKCLIWDRF